MAGTKAGGLKAAATNKIRHGEDFYARIGSKGGSNGHTGGFAANPALAKIAGAKGGLRSRRGPSEETLKIIEAHKADIKLLMKQGMPIQRIANKLGIMPSTLANWIRKNMLELL